MLPERVAVLDGADVGQRKLAHLVRVEREGVALEKLHAAVVPLQHLIAAQRLSGVFVDLEVLVELEQVEQLAEEPPVLALSEVRELAPYYHLPVHEQRQEETTGRELGSKVDEELQNPLEVPPDLQVQLALSRDSLKLFEEVREQHREEEVLAAVDALLLLLLQHRLPALFQVRRLADLQLQPRVAQVLPQRQRHLGEADAADGAVLEALEAVHKKSDKERALANGALFGLEQRHHGLEKGRKHLSALLERVPGWDLLAKLLVDHADEGHEVLRRRGFRVVTRPEVLLQVLAVLERHDPPESKA
mmetsp:Transcript_50897/g.120479  ORF Transcript_50897/g.120479 Transcript_50897/m.120479 type:complete len:304 (-) Transcript_50897:174-1085(-)